MNTPVLLKDAGTSATDWNLIRAALDADGVAVVSRVLESSQCHALRELYARSDRFRSRIVMERHNFGRGEYQYFSEPLPPLVSALRKTVYAELAPLANRWMQRLREDRRFPDTHAEFLGQCHAAGQTRPTPLLLRYRAGDYNCLHQDLYGELSFPLQMVVLLSAPGAEFDGGELVLVEQRPRMQSRPRVIRLEQGDAAIFAVHHRPVAGTRGDYRVNLRHGVGEVRRGERYTLGLIFHDAR